jgi:aspartate ammonia-lyase
MIQRANELHPRKIGAFELWHHRFDLGSIQHAHQDCFDHIIKMGRTQLQDAVPMRLGQCFQA